MRPELTFLSLIRKAGKIEAGEQPVLAALSGRRAVLLVYAADAARNTVHRAVRIAGENGIEAVQLACDKAALGRALGRPPLSLVAVTDSGMARTFLEKRGMTHGE